MLETSEQVCAQLPGPALCIDAREMGHDCRAAKPKLRA
jgi:hypothetical protein